MRSSTAIATTGAMFGSQNDGVSVDANRLDIMMRAITGHFLNSALGQKMLVEPLSALREMCESCAEINWDGEGASPISRNAFKEAERLLFLLPRTIPTPEIVPEPGGAIALEWYREPSKVYVLSVNGTGSLQFAGLFGVGNEEHGRRNFSTLLPPVVLAHFKTLYSA